MQRQFDALQDYHSGTWYLVLACSTAFGLVLDLITSLFIALLCFSFVLLNDNGVFIFFFEFWKVYSHNIFLIVIARVPFFFFSKFSQFLLIDTHTGGVLSSDVGLAISQALILTGSLQFGIKQLAEMMSLMTSVERILQYTNLPKEEPIVSSDPPPPTWPTRGQLSFKNVCMTYNQNDPPVLKVIHYYLSQIARAT